MTGLNTLAGCQIIRRKGATYRETRHHFTLDQAAITANPAAAPPSTGTTQPSGPPTTSPAARGTTGTSSGLPGWAWVALAIAAALIAAVTVIATRRDRR